MKPLRPAPLTLVLIPGFMCDASLWQAMLPELSKIAAVQFADINEGSSIAAMAERIIPSLPEHCVLIGFSLGGYVARRIAYLAPQKLAGLVLVNSSARASTEQELQRNQQQIRMSTLYPYKGQTYTALKRALHPDRSDDAPLLAHLQAMSRNLGQQIFLRQLGLLRQDGHAELAHIKCPSLIIASRNDQMRSMQEAENMADALPNSHLNIIEDCGHMSPLERPEVVCQLLRAWLESEIF
ncbi:MAG: alpha/beta hydrolase [Burkholderiales bacterium]|nr:alpha/beta hydrolase [Burkholderiales bacterium]